MHILCISSLKDVALFLRDNEALFVAKVGGRRAAAAAVLLPSARRRRGVFFDYFFPSARRRKDSVTTHRRRSVTTRRRSPPCAAPLVFVAEVAEVTIMGGVEPFDDDDSVAAAAAVAPSEAAAAAAAADPPREAFLRPDTAHNNAFDAAAAEFFYRRCQELRVPLVVVTRVAAYACPVRRRIYDDLARTGSPVAWRLRATQRASIEALWRRACAPDGSQARRGLPARCDSTWFVKTFCHSGSDVTTATDVARQSSSSRGGGQGGGGGGAYAFGDEPQGLAAMHRSGDDPIWDAVASFNMCVCWANVLIGRSCSIDEATRVRDACVLIVLPPSLESRHHRATAS